MSSSLLAPSVLLIRVLAILLVASPFVQGAAFAEDASAASPGDPVPDVPQTVEVDPAADDARIAERIRGILEATGWFRAPDARVDEGVVFLGGTADSDDHREWASRLAGKTQGVVAVVNRMEVPEASMWDLSPAWRQVRELLAGAVRSAPLFLLAAVLLVITWIVTGTAVRAASYFLAGRLRNPLLRDVAARAVAIPVFLFGLYLVLKVAGLTGLAVTVLGGTGLVGLALGFAFRDIAENFLASILISLQHPFARGDLIQVEGFKGYVQSVNARSTLLMTQDGNHVQISNATIYKATIINYTANPNARFDFAVGIGAEDSIPEAQALALKVLKEHPAVLPDPDPMVLVESLGSATVNLRAYFWVRVTEYSGLKVRSAVIRLIKAAFDDSGISMPDEAREIIFPAGVPVTLRSEGEGGGAAPTPGTEAPPRRSPTSGPATSRAEDDLATEATDIESQARKARVPEEGDFLGA